MKAPRGFFEENGRLYETPQSKLWREVYVACVVFGQPSRGTDEAAKAVRAFNSSDAHVEAKE
jgi:hypothetical protein